MEKIVGNVVANAEAKSFDSGKSVVNFTIAENRYYRDKSGERKQVTRFFECAYWTKGVGIADYLVTGKLVEIEGSIGVRAYIQDENKKTRKAVGVLTLKVRELHFPNSPRNNNSSEIPPTEITGDEVPF